MTCNVRQNTINTLKEKKIIDDNLFVISPLFWEENRKFSNLARTKYKVQNQGLLFSTETTRNDKVKAVPNEVFFKELQERFDMQNTGIPSIGSRDNLEYQLKVVDIVSKNIQKINDWYKKIGNTGVFWNKLQQDLQIPKEQLELLKESEGATIEEKLASFVANYSYTVQINTTEEEQNIPDYDSETGEQKFTVSGKNYRQHLDGNGDIQYSRNDKSITYKEYKQAYKLYKETEFKPYKTPTQHYSNLTVPGGTNYTENEIATPAITPSIKGHAQFATDNGIGWFRSDDKAIITDTTALEDEDKYYSEAEGGWVYTNQIKEPTKTRRILELQSDLFQKGRDKEFLVDNYKHTPGDRNFNVTYEGKEYKVGTMGGMQRVVIYKTLEGQVHYENPKQDWLTQEEIPQGLKDIVSNKFNSLKQEVLTQNKSNKENQFLQLLNKDNNWVTFFIKSIIQDSAKKGYEKVLFPSGNTASKVEGHTTLEEFKKEKERRIKSLEESKIKSLEEVASLTGYFDFANESGLEPYSPEANKAYKEKLDEDADREINQLKKELERVEKEGFGSLKPIYKFYQEDVFNILKKQGYNPKEVTDEYGNTWYEVGIVEEFTKPVLLQTKESSEKMKKASPKTLRKLKEFLKRIGVDLKNVPYITHNGQRLDANGIAEIFGNLIRIVEGKENVALPEEAMHFATYLIRQTNKELYKKLLNSVSSTPEYEEFFSEYAKLYRTHDGKPDIPKIKFEIIGKVLANQYVANENKTWLQWIIEAIKNLFVKANIDPFAEALQGLDKLESVENIRIESIVEDIRQGVKGTMWEQGFKELSPEQILRESYEQIKSAGVSYIDQALSGNDELADEIVDFYENMTFLQVTPETIVKKLDETNRKVVNKTVVNDKTGEAESDYYIDGKKVKDRVTRKIKRVMKFEFRDRKITPWQKQIEDQMREWGSKGHKDLERLFKKYLRADGTIEIVRNEDGQDILKPQNDTIIQSEMDPEDLGIFEVLEKNVVNILMSYPEGTKFRVEQVIYTPNGGEVGQRDLAGTIDFLAIKPNGKVDVLDWKFTRVNKDKYDDLGWFKQNEWKMQMEEYRKILKKEYGILESQFEKTRMIPFIVEYEREDFTNNKSPYVPVSVETAGLNVAIDTKTYLLPVSSATEATGSEKLDTLISSLVQLYETLKKIPATDNRRDIKNEQLNSLFKSIRHLQGAQNLEPLVDQMKLAVEQTKEFIKGFRENENLDNLSEAEISEMASEMLIKIQSLQIFEKVFPTILDVFDNPSEDVAEMVDHISEVSSDIVVQKNAMQSLIENFAQKYIASRRGIEGLKEAEKQVTGITRMFGTTSEIPTAALRTLFTIVENSTNNAKLDTQDAISELEEIKKEVNEWGGLKKLLQTVKKKDKNRLIDEYDPKFYDELKIAMENGDGEWIEKNIDIHEYQDALFEKRKQQLKYIEQTTFFSDPERNEEKKKELKDKLIKITDIGNVEAYFSQDNYYVMRKFPNKKWITEEFKELQKNEPALKFYNFIRKINEKAKEVGYLQKESVRGFLPYIYKSFSEKLANGGTLSFSDWLTNSLTIDENVAGYGDFNELSGRIEDNLPRYFVREIEDESQISEDLFTNAAIYAKAVIDYEYKSQVEGQIKALYFIEQNKKSIETNVFGRIVRGTANQPKKVPSNEKNADLLLKHIQTTFYGQKYASSGTTDVLLGDWVTRYNEFAEKARKKYNIPFPKLNENTDGKQISVTRTIDTLNHWFRMKNLGLNVASSMSVFFGGNFQALINSGKYYTGKQFLASEWKYASHFKIKDEELHFALIKQFLPVDEELQRRINQLSASKINANSFSDFMMVLMRRADYSVQYANFLSFMENTIVIDGKLHNARDYYRNSPDYANRYKLPEEQRKKMESEFEEKVQELIDKNGIINKSQVKDGKLAIEGVNFRDPKNLEYRTLIQTIGRKATGNISPENEMLMRMNVIGKSMMVFKNWIPGLVKQRFGGLRYDESVNDWEYGRVRMIVKHLGFFAFARIRDINNIIKGNEEGLKLIMKYYEKQKSDFVESGGDPSKFMSEAQFADAMRLALQMQMKELAILFSSLGMLYAVLPGLAPDDEDKEAKNRFNFARRMVDKISDEVWFYYSPMQTQQILNGSIFPSLGLLTDASKVLSSTSKEIWGLVTENDELVEKNYPLKNLMKALPITREVPYYIAMFDADLAKELGIKISTQSRMR